MSDEEKIRFRELSAELAQLRAERDRLLADNERLKSYQLSGPELDRVLERWDQTRPELQRQIVAAFSTRCVAAEAENARLAARCEGLEDACRETMAVVDEAYLATNYIKVAKTSYQRLRIEAALAGSEGEGRAR